MGVKKGFTSGQIIGKLRKAEVLMSKRATLADVCRKIGVTDVTLRNRFKELVSRLGINITGE